MPALEAANCQRVAGFLTSQSPTSGQFAVSVIEPLQPGQLPRGSD